MRSRSVDLDKVYEIAKHNPKNAIQMLVLYLKIQALDGRKKNGKML